ncbi:uncharacterized protein [Macaca nemestrina]|uniref:uncharacterized protein n=1 Tax=Macaca nemestrina TaxID=9545 RepID=UPI0039B9C0B8
MVSCPSGASRPASPSPAPPRPAPPRPAPLPPGSHPSPGPKPGARLARRPQSLPAIRRPGRCVLRPLPPRQRSPSQPRGPHSVQGGWAARLSGRGWSGRPSQWGAAAAAAVAVAVAVAAVWDPDGLRWRRREAEGGSVGCSGGGRKVAAPVLLRVSVQRWERVTDMQCAPPPGSCSPSAPTMWSWRRSGTTGRLRPGTWMKCCACLQVDIVPLITKADTISKHDLQMFKSKIMSELISNGVQIYQLPADEETAAQANSSINKCLSPPTMLLRPPQPCGSMLLPFAVVGSMDEVKVAERMVRGRHYPWGVLQGAVAGVEGVGTKPEKQAEVFHQQWPVEALPSDLGDSRAK